MLLRGVVDVTERAARADPGQERLRVDVDALEPRHVQRDTAVGQRQTRDVVSAALDRQLQLVVANEVDGPDHVQVGLGPNHHGGPLLDHPVPEQGRLRESLIVGVQHGTFEIGGQGVQVPARDLASVARETGDHEVCHLLLHLGFAVA